MGEVNILVNAIEEALDEYRVEDREAHDPTIVAWWPEGFRWGVSTSERGVVALFTTEEAANSYRLALVSQAVGLLKVSGLYLDHG